MSVETRIKRSLATKTQNYSLPSSILGMSLIPLAVNYIEKNGAPQESGSTKEKIGLLNGDFDIPKKLLMAEKRRKIETISGLVCFLKDG